MNRPRMLVTGGSGYLGGRVVELAQKEWDVAATYLTASAGQEGVTWLRLDIGDEVAVTAAMELHQPGVVIHTAAANPGSDRDLDVNVAGTANIACAARDLGARLVHISTDVVFDGARGGYTEDDVPNPITPYGVSKAQAEDAVQASGAAAVIVRTSLIYGWQPSIDRHTSWVIDALEAGEQPRLFTDELRCPIWVDSLAAALIELASLEYIGVLHVAGAQVLSRYEFGLRMLRYHGVDPVGVVAAPSRESGMERPLDCSLDLSRAHAVLSTPLPGVDAVLRQNPKH